MKKLLSLWMLVTAFAFGAYAQQDTKEYKTYVKNDRLVHYCTHQGVTVVVDPVDFGKWDITLTIINKSGHEILFKPQLVKARCYTASGNLANEVKHSLERFLKSKLDTASLPKEELEIYSSGKGITRRSNSYAIGEYGSTLTYICKRLDEISALQGKNMYASRVLPYQNGENERLRKFRMHQWCANTLPDFSECQGYVLINGIKADHVLLEIPVDGETYTFLLYDKEDY